MKISRRILLASGTALAMVAAGYVGKVYLANAQANRVVNLYSARHYDTDNAIYQGFTKKTGIKVNLVEADADKLIERIRSEGANSPADVLITVDAGRLSRAQAAGILQPVNSQALRSAVPANLRDPNNHWFGLSKRARVIVYNKARVKPAELASYEALADAKWKGRLISRSSNHVYNQSLIGSILAARGPQATEKWARGIVGNFASPPEGNDTAQIKKVASGAADVTFVNTYYVARLMESKKPEDQAVAAKIGVIFPNQRDRGTHINISGGGVVKTSRNRDAAVKFLEYLASPEAQAIFARSNNEYPVRAGVTLDPVVARMGKFKEDKLNASTFGRNNAEALKIADRAGWK
ncbi:Fe(3+) ABC transporter substrate-binding protein [Pantanalinema sp. GBBB05]|uniref:Fe(3+) ABC transporter substrate-binding protein n=1 Tax=Pantanalinema sp. GBBB05 TaxID=2604139 RepID=UPI001D41D757|nr:Fe(3+) ABC transporter substrate-binding protein [Pantanalinema sp. GBBB05]